MHKLTCRKFAPLKLAPLKLAPLKLAPVLMVLALALATSSTGLSQDPASPGNSDSSGANGEPSVGEKTSIGKHRFDPSPARDYLIQRARKESEAREELLRHVWNLESRGMETRTIDMHIAHLRTKLRDVEQTMLVTVRGKGYRWSAT